MQLCAARGGLGLASKGVLLTSVVDSVGINFRALYFVYYRAVRSWAVLQDHICWFNLKQNWHCECIPEVQLLVSSGIHFWSWKTEVFLAPVKENIIKNSLFCIQRYLDAETGFWKSLFLLVCKCGVSTAQEKTRRVILWLSSSGFSCLRHVRRRWWLSPWLCSVWDRNAGTGGLLLYWQRL